MKDINIENKGSSMDIYNSPSFKDEARPSLPDAIEIDYDLSISSMEKLVDAEISSLQQIKAGCYLLKYIPSPIGGSGLPSLHYDGTLRIQLDGANVIASGDLYLHQISSTSTSPFRSEPNPSQGIPIFRRSNYRYYLRVVRIQRSLTRYNNYIWTLSLCKF